MSLCLFAAGFSALPQTPSPLPACGGPITFKIGAIDARFGIAPGDAQEIIEQAGAVWEAGANRKLFQYDPDGALTINLVYDARQQATQVYNERRAGIAGTSQEAASVTQELAALKGSFQEDEKSYSNQLAAFERLRSVATLAGNKSALNEQLESLRREKAHLVQVSTKINDLTDKANSLIEVANAKIVVLNTGVAAADEFDAGHFVEERGQTHIDIYQFKDRSGLRIVLAHELGHALKLPHNSNPASIMAPVIQAQSLSLSTDDLSALKQKKSGCWPSLGPLAYLP